MTQSKEDLLLDAALRLFNEFGFHATPTSKITKEAGVSAGTLYNYFESKEDLINKLYMKSKLHFADYMRANWEESSDMKDNFKKMWSLFINWGLEYPDYFKFKETFSMSPFIENLSKDAVSDNFDFLMRCANRAIEEGTIKKEDFPMVTAIIHGTAIDVIKYLPELTSNQEKEEVIERCFDLIWSGIKNN